MTDRTMVDKLDGWARAMLPDDVLEQEQANRAVVRRDNTVDPDAIGSVLTVPIYLAIDGALTAANTIGGATARARVLQDVTIRQVWLDAGTAPTAPNSCTVWIVADGTRKIEASLAAGITTGVSPASVDINAGALLTVDCTAANGAADVSIAIATRPRGR